MADPYRQLLSICLVAVLSSTATAKGQYSMQSLRCEELKPWSTLLHCKRTEEPALRDAGNSSNAAMTRTLAWGALPIGLLAIGVADRRRALKRARN